MKANDFKNIKIDDILYHSDTNTVVFVTSQLSSQETPMEKVCLSSRKLSDESLLAVCAKDFRKWHYVDSNAPVEVRLEFLEYQIGVLEEFVRQRLI